VDEDVSHRRLSRRESRVFWMSTLASRNFCGEKGDIFRIPEILRVMFLSILRPETVNREKSRLWETPRRLSGYFQ
jgi:hypothetical protein